MRGEAGIFGVRGLIRQTGVILDPDVANLRQFRTLYAIQQVGGYALNLGIATLEHQRQHLLRNARRAGKLQQDPARSGDDFRFGEQVEVKLIEVREKLDELRCLVIALSDANGQAEPRME